MTLRTVHTSAIKEEQHCYQQAAGTLTSVFLHCNATDFPNSTCTFHISWLLNYLYFVTKYPECVPENFQYLINSSLVYDLLITKFYENFNDNFSRHPAKKQTNGSKILHLCVTILSCYLATKLYNKIFANWQLGGQHSFLCKQTCYAGSQAVLLGPLHFQRSEIINANQTWL